MKSQLMLSILVLFLFTFVHSVEPPTSGPPSETERSQQETDTDDWDRELTPFGVQFFKGGQTPALLEKAFVSRDPFAAYEWTLDDRMIGSLYNLAKQTSNPEEVGKRWALIGHFSYWQKRETSDVFRTLPATIKEYFGKELSIDQAFEEVKTWYSGTPVPTEGVRLRARIRCAGFGGAAVAAALAALLASVLFLWRRRARIARFFSRLAPKGRFADLPAWRKYHIALSAVAFVLLALAAADLDAPYGFFVFLRIVACVSFLGFLACRLPFPLKFLSLLAAILYNPVAMVRFDDRDPWIVCNCVSLLLLAAIGFVQAWQSRKNP